jgi:hypothetical protein
LHVHFFLFLLINLIGLIDFVHYFASFFSLAIHLSIAKMMGSRSISYISIEPDLEKIDILADVILQDLRSNPSDYIGEVRRHEAELIESFYYTVTDKEKVSTRSFVV